MPPTVSQQASNTSSSTGGVSSRLKMMVIALVVIVVAAGGFLYLHNRSAKPETSSLRAFKHTYSAFKPYTLTGTEAGSGASFDRPVEFAGPASGTGRAAFVQATSNNQHQTVPLAEMAIYSSPISIPYATSYLKYMNQLIIARNAAAQGTLKPASDFVAQGIDSGYVVKAGVAKQFVTANLKVNAWEIPITATAKVPQTNTTLPNQQGEVIYAIGQKGIYYLMAMAADYNWTASQSTWQQVIKSLKIDQ